VTRTNFLSIVTAGVWSAIRHGHGNYFLLSWRKRKSRSCRTWTCCGLGPTGTTERRASCRCSRRLDPCALPAPGGWGQRFYRNTRARTSRYTPSGSTWCPRTHARSGRRTSSTTRASFTSGTSRGSSGIGTNSTSQSEERARSGTPTFSTARKPHGATTLRGSSAGGAPSWDRATACSETSSICSALARDNRRGNDAASARAPRTRPVTFARPRRSLD
jgi:hypothetical protein